MAKTRTRTLRLDTDIMRRQRAAKGLTQAHLADLARMGHAQVSLAETGVLVSPDTARRIALALAVPVELLVLPPDRA